MTAAINPIISNIGIFIVAHIPNCTNKGGIIAHKLAIIIANHTIAIAIIKGPIISHPDTIKSINPPKALPSILTPIMSALITLIKLSEFIILLNACDIGVNALSKPFFILFHTSANVIGICLN